MKPCLPPTFSKAVQTSLITISFLGGHPKTGHFQRCWDGKFLLLSLRMKQACFPVRIQDVAADCGRDEARAGANARPEAGCGTRAVDRVSVLRERRLPTR